MKICKPYKSFTHEKITQKFHDGHKAIDAVASYGTPMVAPEDATVERVVTPNCLLDEVDNEYIRYGYGVVLKGKSGYYTLYWHCQGVLPVNEGQEVKQGQIVAYMGNSGFVYSFGRYVPVEIRTKDPYQGTHVHWEFYQEENGVRTYLNPVEYVNWNIQLRYDILTAASVVLRKMLNILQRR